MAQEFFADWLQANATRRGIRSARRLANEAGLTPLQVGDWLLGVGLPSDEECRALAAYLGVAVDDVRARRVLPPRRRP